MAAFTNSLLAIARRSSFHRLLPNIFSRTYKTYAKDAKDQKQMEEVIETGIKKFPVIAKTLTELREAEKLRKESFLFGDPHEGLERMQGGNVFLNTYMLNIYENRFQRSLVHEVRHAIDLGGILAPSSVERYESEKRAHAVQAQLHLDQILYGLEAIAALSDDDVNLLYAYLTNNIHGYLLTRPHYRDIFIQTNDILVEDSKAKRDIQNTPKEEKLFAIRGWFLSQIETNRF